MRPNGKHALLIAALAILVAMASLPLLPSDDSDAAYSSSRSHSYEIGSSFSESFAMPYRSAGSTTQLSSQNVPGWVTATGSNGYSMISGTAPSSQGVYNFSVTYRYSGSTSTEQCTVNYTLTIYIPDRTVTLDPNGGSVSTGQIVSKAGAAVTLPAATKAGATFDGWYGGGTRVGGAGASYVPPSDIRLTARYTQDAVQFTIAGLSTVATSYTVPYNGYVELSFQTLPADAVASVSSNTFHLPLSLSGTGGGKALRGSILEILPGTYFVTVRASAAGYGDATLTVQINVATAILDPITASIYVNQDWHYQITTIPSYAKIVGSLTTVTDGSGATVPWQAYSIQTSDRSFSVRFFEPNTYHIGIVVASPSNPPGSKQIVLHVKPDEAIAAAPFAAGITAALNGQVDGGYYFTVDGAVNYQYLRWDYGDGSAPASEQSVTHRFATNGRFQVSCTLHNTTTGQQYTVFTSVSILLKQQMGTDAWVGTPYSYAFPADGDGEVTMGTDVDQSWLQVRTYEVDGRRHVELHSPDGPLPALAGSDLEVSVYIGGAKAMTMSIHIWPAVDEAGTGFLINLSADGYAVTLANTGSSAASYIVVEWGDGRNSRLPSMAGGTHVYDRPGAYTVKASYIGNGGEVGSAYGMVSVPSAETSYTIAYDGNGGTGSMPPSTGRDIAVQANDFVRDGHEFESWNTRADGTGTAFAPGDLVNSLTADMTLYAIWGAVHVEEGAGDHADAFWEQRVLGIPLWAAAVAALALLTCAAIVARDG